MKIGTIPFNTNMLKNKIFKQGIGIAEKVKKQEGIAGVVM